MSIAANRFEGIRASMVTDVDSARKTREHNDSNVLVLGAWKNSREELAAIFDAWYAEKWGAGRHIHRVKKIDAQRAAVVVIAGSFDGLTPSHIDLVNYCRQLGKVVAIVESDHAVEQRTGARPRFQTEARRGMVGALAGIEEVVVSDDISIAELVRQIGATYLVHGSEDAVASASFDSVDVQVIPWTANPA
jgi:glycerol-3-phosphate cytidylyltransferase-like family protein